MLPRPLNGLTIGYFQGVPDFAGERCVLAGFHGIVLVGLISGLAEIKYEGEDGLDCSWLLAAVALALLVVRSRLGPPVIPLLGGRPFLVRRPPPPLFSVTVPSSKRHHGCSQYCKRADYAVSSGNRLTTTNTA